MKYRDYMNEFTVLDETKSVLRKRMKQRARQLQAARMERAPSAAATTAETKKRSTFRLHPKRWIAIAVSIALVIAAIPTVYFTAFRGPGGPDGNQLNSIKLSYMDNMMVETDGVTAYSIKRETETENTATSAQGNKKAAISLLSATLVEDTAKVQPLAAKTKTRNYLYSTSENYEFGNVEYDESGITRVTFKKNSEVTEDVYDDNGELIDSNREIKQEELDAVINKIYTTKEFTYIQFVAPVEKSGSYNYKTADGKTGYEHVYLRPESMTYDEYGVADFDKGIPSDSQWGYGKEEGCDYELSYYSSYLSASFVIDNSTGYIYKIENFRIDGFHNGLVKSYVPDQWGNIDYHQSGLQKANYYSISVDENHNLVFTDVLPNKDVEVNNVFMDRYGWTYVLNNRVDEIDRERKTIYTTDTEKYVYDSEKNVYVTDRGSNGNNFALGKQMVDGVESGIQASVIRGLREIYREWNGDEKDYQLSGMYHNLSVWRNPIQKVFYIDPQADTYEYAVAYNESTNFGITISQAGAGVGWGDWREEYGRWLDTNYDTLLLFVDKNLSYAKVDLSACLNTRKVLEASDFKKLNNRDLYQAENFYLTVGKDQYKVNDVYYYSSVNGTQYYHVVRTETGVELAELTSKSYSDTVFIFQPINK